MELPMLQKQIPVLQASIQGPERISKLVQDFHVPKHGEKWSVNEKESVIT